MAKAKKEARAVAQPQPTAAQRKPLGWLLSPGSLAQHPPGVLLTDAIVLVILLLVTLLINNFLPFLNAQNVFFVRPGSLLLLVFSVATLIYILKMIAHLFHAIARLRNVYKIVLFVLVVIGAVWVFLHQGWVMPLVIDFLGSIPWGNLNPLTFVLY